MRNNKQASKQTCPLNKLGYDAEIVVSQWHWPPGHQLQKWPEHSCRSLVRHVCTQQSISISKHRGQICAAHSEQADLWWSCVLLVQSRTQQPVASHSLNCQKYSAGLSKGMFVSQQLIPASSGFDHNSAQKDVRHFPAIQVSCHSCLPCKHWKL